MIGGWLGQGDPPAHGGTMQTGVIGGIGPMFSDPSLRFFFLVRACVLLLVLCAS